MILPQFCMPEFVDSPMKAISPLRNGAGDRKGRLGLVCKMKTFLVKNLSPCVWQGGGSRTRIPLSWTVGQMTILTLQILHPRLFLPRLLRGPAVFEELSGGIEGDTGHLP